MLVIYTRLSKEDEGSASIQNQIREGRVFGKLNEFSDIEVYDEGEGVSGGADIKDRPQLFRLLQDFKDGNIKAVWFRNQNRLERNSNTWHIFISEAKKYNIKVYFNDKLFDFENPQENLFGSITSALNQYQKDLQSAQTKRTLRDNVAEGKVWSVIAYGYKSNNGFLAIDNKEAEIVKQIYKLSLSGIGTQTIANKLNEKGIPTRKNKLWRTKTIQGIIKNTIYKGIRIFSGVNYNSPIIIEPKLWLKVNENLIKNRNNSGKKVDHKYLLKGIIKCGRCRRNYYGRRRVDMSENYYTCSSKRYKEYNCGNKSINIHFLETLIWNHFFAENQFKDLLEEYFQKQLNTNPINEIDVNIESSKKVLHKRKKDKERLINLALDGVLSNNDIKYKIKQINDEINNSDIKLNNLKEQKNTIEQNLKNQDKTLKEVSIEYDISFNDKLKIVNKHLKEINIYFEENLNGYFIEIISNIGRINSVYFAPYSKKYAYTIDTGRTTKFYLAIETKMMNNSVINGSIGYIIDIDKVFKKTKDDALDNIV